MDRYSHATGGEGVLAPAPPPDEEARARAREHLNGLLKPPGSLGRLEELGAHWAAMTGQIPPRAERKAVVVAAADHGVVEEGVSAYPAEVTSLMVRAFCEGKAAINALARQLKATVVCIDVGVKGPGSPQPGSVAGNGVGQGESLSAGDVIFRRHPIRPGTDNFTRGPAMTRQEAWQAVNLGMGLATELRERGFDVLIAGEMGIGNTTASAALIAVLTHSPVHRVVGPGSGLSPEGVARKREAVRKAIQVNGPYGDGLDILAKLGGLEIAVLAGLMVGAAARRTPVVIDGLISTAAATVAEALSAGTRHYLIAGHRSAEPGHKAALRHLGLQPYLDLGMRLGEGTGAALACHLLDAVSAVMREMGSLSDFGITASEAVAEEASPWA